MQDPSCAMNMIKIAEKDLSPLCSAYGEEERTNRIVMACRWLARTFHTTDSEAA